MSFALLGIGGRDVVSPESRVSFALLGLGGRDVVSPESMFFGSHYENLHCIAVISAEISEIRNDGDSHYIAHDEE